MWYRLLQCQLICVGLSHRDRCIRIERAFSSGFSCIHQIKSNWFSFVVGLTSAEWKRLFCKQKNVCPFLKFLCWIDRVWNCWIDIVRNCCGRYRYVVSSAPTILRPWVWIPSIPSMLFSICIIEILMRKVRK